MLRHVVCAHASIGLEQQGKDRLDSFATVAVQLALGYLCGEKSVHQGQVVLINHMCLEDQVPENSIAAHSVKKTKLQTTWYRFLFLFILLLSNPLCDVWFLIRHGLQDKTASESLHTRLQIAQVRDKSSQSPSQSHQYFIYRVPDGGICSWSCCF
jgi:hypothetical protein